jgi:hypothetical protein
MDKTQIRESVQGEIKKWTTLQNTRQINVSFTPKTVDFLCLMIENIQEDKSQFWDYSQFESGAAQELAISLIPNALNELFYRRGRPFLRRQREREIKISTWELWHSLSPIIDRFCFIEKTT